MRYQLIDRDTGETLHISMSIPSIKSLEKTYLTKGIKTLTLVTLLNKSFKQKDLKAS